MEQRWPLRGALVAVALMVGLGACSDSPVEPVAANDAAPADVRASIDIGEVWVTVSGGLGFTCGTTLDGGTYCWGDNGAGQLGTGGFTGSATPARVTGVPSAWAASTGAAHACVLARTGRVYCWGDNSSGQLGNGTTTLSATPVQVQAPAGVVFASVTTGAIHSCAQALDGAVWCWGDNSLGQLGNGTTSNSSVPVRVQVPNGVHLLSVVSGDGAAHTCGVASNGSAYCWGDNSYGQLGTGSASSTPATAPVKVAAAPGLKFAAVSGSGFSHSCAISTAAEAYCWGDNTNGQIGDGTTTQRLAPTHVSGTRRFTSLVTGWFHSCAATFLSGAYCWGDAFAGKLGNNQTTGSSPLPVAVIGSQGFGRMDPGADHSCSRRRDGAAFCWGQGFSGQLGDGNGTNLGVPVRVADPSSGPSPSRAPAFSRAAGADAPAQDGTETWCRARADRARIAACS
jgi:alpha-tubulin suppressor-like RCC1 family protein